LNFYSFGTRIDLDETCLDETVGVGEDPIDWNRDGVFDTSVVADINHPAGSPGDGRFDPLLDLDDYSNLYLAVAGGARDTGPVEDDPFDDSVPTVPIPMIYQRRFSKPVASTQIVRGGPR
jgi:hypothetical protein